MTSADAIELMGGTAEVARLCEVKQPSVSEWKLSGIPRARLQYLKVVRPDLPWADLEQPANTEQ
jgi:DNA-binding transcriptional regulator YdaS (Cro superfamily)